MDVAIIGAGVAGLSSAIALTQLGHRVRIFERRPLPENIGAGFVLWPNALYVLDQLGLLDCLANDAGQPRFMHRVSSEGESLGSIDISKISQQMGYPAFSLLRSVFQQRLTEQLLQLGVSVQYNHTAKQIQNINDNQAEVSFSNGAVVRADVLIGADGRMQSIARRYIQQQNHRPVFHNFINWIGISEHDSDIYHETDILDFWGTGERFGIVPINRRKAYWAGGIACDQISALNPSQYHQELTDTFTGWPDIIQQTLQRSPLHTINKLYVHDHDPAQCWHKNNLIMIGDAAHAALPTSGQGACQALEDAWHLSHCLNRHQNNLANAFTEFTAMRLHKTTSIINTGRQLAASLFNTDPDYCRQRNAQSLQTDYSAMAQGMAQSWSAGLSLPV